MISVLRAGGYRPEWRVVGTELAFIAALEDLPEIVLCGHAVPRLGSSRALEILHERGDPAPLVIVSGTIGEEAAVEAMRDGAADYLLKDRLTLLGIAVERALERSHEATARREGEAALVDADAQNRALIEKIPATVYIWTLGQEPGIFTVTYVSQQIEGVLGFPREEWLGDPTLWAARVDPRDRQEVLDHVARRLGSELPFEMQYRMVAKDGHVVWLHDHAAVASRDEDGTATHYQGIQLEITAQRDAEAEAALATGQVRILEGQRHRLLGRIASIQDEERRRVADGIHDDTMGSLVAIGLRLGTLSANHPELETDNNVVDALRLVEHATSSLRDLIFELHPIDLESSGIEVTLRTYLDRLARTPGGPDYRLRASLEDQLPRAIRTLMYRIAQEAIANARTHAQASLVEVSLEQRDGGFFSTVVDDGVGFDVGETPSSPFGHLGLTLMQERAEFGGGWLQIRSEPGSGTSVEFWLPNEDPNESSGAELGSRSD